MKRLVKTSSPSCYRRLAPNCIMVADLFVHRVLERR
jgi:hypothetical protein